jgi:hypothetical protein
LYPALTGLNISVDESFPRAALRSALGYRILPIQGHRTTSLLPSDCMETEEFQELICKRPVLIRMNDGREFFIDKEQTVMVGDYTAGFLVDDEGVKRNAVITLSNVSTVIPRLTRPMD